MSLSEADAIAELARRDEVSEAHSRKPDPNQPWRYVCPECGSQVTGNASFAGAKYACTNKSCRRTVPAGELLDQKTGEQVMNTDESVTFVYQ